MTATPIATESTSARLMTEGLISVAEARDQFPQSRGVKVSQPCVSRWMTNGVRLADGRVVKLEFARCGGRIFTSRPAIVRFIEAQNGVAAATLTGAAAEMG